MAGKKTTITLEVDDKGTATVKRFDKETRDAFSRMKNNTKAATNSMDTSFKKLKSHWAAYSAAGIAAVVAVGLGIKKLTNTIRDWTKLSMIQEDAEIGLAASLKAHLEYTDELNKSYQGFATSIQKVTRYGDEEVLNLMALIKNLGVTSDKLEESTKMAIGLATATNRDVRSMAQYIALAQQGEFTMLRRYIPALRKTNDATEQLRIVTEFAARGFKVAQETTDTFSGSLKQTGNLWGDLREKIASVITENQTVLDLMKRTREWLIRVGEKVDAWRKKNQALIDKKMEEYLDTTLNLLTGIAEAVKLVYRGYEKLVKLIKDNQVTFNLPIIGQIAMLKKVLEEWGKYKRSLKETSDTQEEIRRKIEKPLDEVFWVDLTKFNQDFKEDLAIINYHLEGFRLQSVAAWAAYRKGMQETIPDQNKFIEGIAGEQTAIMLLEKEIDEGLAQSLKSIDEKGVTTFDHLKNAVTGWASTFSSQLNDMLWTAETTFADILESFGRMITQMVIQKQVVEPMLGLDWSKIFTGAHGGVFQKGSIIPYGRGGIVERPTIFPMATGAGLMGEKGPEGVLPLTRTRSGDLGVKTQGAGTNIEINMINQSGHALEATQSRLQSGQESGKYIIDVVVKELQRGRTLRQMIRSTI